MSEPIRVLHIVTTMNRGGLETMLMNYYRNIDKSKIQFDFLLHRSEKSDYEDEIKDLGEEKPNVITFDITNFSEEQKEKLRCAIKYFSGDRNNMNVQVKIGEDIKPCGAIYYNDEVKKIFDRI